MAEATKDPAALPQQSVPETSSDVSPKPKDSSADKGQEKEVHDDEVATEVKEPLFKKTIAPALLGDDANSNCECWPTEVGACGIPDNATSIQSECTCIADCEHPDADGNKSDKGKRTSFSINPAEFKNTGKLQSPIAITLQNVVVKNYPPLEFSPMHYDVPERMFVELKDTYDVFLTYNLGASPRLSGGPLKTPYKLLKLQFHWGTDDDKGSEHTVDVKVYVMELHAVYIQEMLNKDTATSSANGYVIVSYFFQLENKSDNPAVDVLLKNFEVLDGKMPKDQNHQIDIEEPFAVKGLIDTFNESYITYEGSLTEKPFTENVTWILAPYCIKISPTQMTRFRALKDVKPNNYRQQQDIQNRTVNIVEREGNIFRRIPKTE